ncbi:MAG: hypothetical protein ABII22_02240 [Candidatus Micrarchaeota archaeon]
MQMRYRKERHGFQKPNVLGIPGHVFGRHWHQRRGAKVPSDNAEMRDEVHIRWPTAIEVKMHLFPGRCPFILPNDDHWGVTRTKLDEIEMAQQFPISVHCRTLVSQVIMPVILYWGCGRGTAVRTLAEDPEIKGRALIFGYGDL